jgi:hypothetical protein
MIGSIAAAISFVRRRRRKTAILPLEHLEHGRERRGGDLRP